MIQPILRKIHRYYSERLINKKMLILIIVLTGIIAVSAGLKFIFHVDGSTFFSDLFLLKYLPRLDNNASYGLLFIFGVLTSFHCIGMCGGIAISQTIRRRQAEGEKNKAHTLILPSLFYNLGRVISYTLVGAIVGGLGQIISFSGVWKGIVPIIGGIFMLIMAINLMGIFPFLRRLNIRVPSFFAKKLFRENQYSPLLIGILTGLMPCGPLQMVQLYALSTRSVIHGATSMFVFSLGTVPLLFTFGILNTFLNRKFTKVIIKFSAVLVLFLGIVMIGRGLALSGLSFGMMNMTNGENAVAAVDPDGKSQTLRTELKPDSFPAIAVVKGIPVKWTMSVEQENLNDCNKALQAPKLKIETSLHVGDNLIEFTPAETGDFIYTCWMGMIKSKITVVENIDELKKVRIQDPGSGDHDRTANHENTQGNAQTDQESSPAAQSLPGAIQESKTVPEKIAITKPADKLTYKVGDQLVITGIEVTGTYRDGTKAVIPVTAANVTGFDSSAARDRQTLTITVAGKTAAYTISIKGAPIEQTLTGYIQDAHCFFAFANPAEDTKGCLSMRSCAKSGYGITILQNDGSKKFCFFDGEFAVFADGKTFDGTGSQLTAWNLIRNTKKQNNITITVTGTFTGTEKIYADNGRSYTFPVLRVSSLVEH